MIGAGSALLLLLASPAHDSGAHLTFGGDSAKAATNDKGNGKEGGNASGAGLGGTPPATGTAVPSASRDAAIVKLKAYRKAVLGNDLDAAAAALASVKREIAAREIGQINEILGLNSQTTTLTTEDIVRGVREIASRRP